MDISTHLQILDQHLSLLVDATQNTATLTGESVASTLLLIQNKIKIIQEKVKNTTSE